jgi:hypothetical protein
MNYARLKVLGIKAPIGHRVYHDDGYVASIEVHTRRINEIYGSGGLSSNGNFQGHILGRHSTRGRHHHIFYLRQPTREANAVVRAHEETHMLDSADGLDLLAERLLDRQGVRINFKEIDDREVRAQLGALYALQLRGISPDMLFGKYAAKARRLYEQSRCSKEKISIGKS